MHSNGEYSPNDRYLARVQPVTVEGQANDNVRCSPVGGDGSGSCRLRAELHARGRRSITEVFKS